MIVYDILDHPTSITTKVDANRIRTITKVYDASERLTETQEENGTKEVYEYDEQDRLTRK